MISIRKKILLIAIPLFVLCMILLTMISTGFARNGITKIASEFLGYKITQIVAKVDSEINSLTSYSSEAELSNYMEEIKLSIPQYVSSIQKEYSETFFAVDTRGVVIITTDSELPIGTEIDFFDVIREQKNSWITFKQNGFDKVGFCRYYEKMDLFFILSSYSDIFYFDSQKIMQNSVFILIISLLVATILLRYLVFRILRPLDDVVYTMNRIIDSGDISRRVPIRYNDEIGNLSYTFNSMLDNLNAANKTIREYAFQSILSKKREERINLMFQKYVPQDVIDEVVHNPDKALIGKNSNVTVLFSDIRSFTTISESMEPEKLVKALNKYFTLMVDVIYKRKGVIDKYIGDAIMAIFGAPKEHMDDPQQAVFAALEMMEELENFNKIQRENGEREFHIGIGINYGIVTVGNIGSTQKMDYTVIGDTVNLASRLEGLTKEYKVPVIISENTYLAIKDFFYVREIDRVRVKGKLKPVKIFQPARYLSDDEKKGWKFYNDAVRFFTEREWDKSKNLIEKALQYLKNDPLCLHYRETIRYYKENPPPANWDGVTTMTHK